MRLLVPTLAAILGACWLMFLTGGSRMATAFATRFGGTIQKVSKGKVADPAVFTYERGRELLLLATVVCVLGVVLWLFAKWVRQKGWKFGWVYQALALFIALNMLVGIAMRTALFWGAMFTGSRTANYTQFQFKRLLVNESKAPLSALLLGSSQTQAQIDENQLNGMLGTNVWSTELHFPGSAGLDLYLVYENIRGCRADFLIIYVSENTFFNGLHTETPPFFARLEQIPVLRSMGLRGEVFSKSFRYGYFAEIIPLFRAREAISHRVLGADIGLLGQATHDVGLEIDLEKRAEEVARLFDDDYAEVHKRGLEEFVRRAAGDGRRIILLEGQLNPVLGRRLPAAMRQEMKRFLGEMADRYSSVEVVPEAKLPAQDVGDYMDLTHVTAAGQQRFTSWLAGYLQGKTGSGGGQ